MPAASRAVNSRLVSLSSVGEPVDADYPSRRAACVIRVAAHDDDALVHFAVCALAEVDICGTHMCDRSLAGGLVFSQVRGHTRKGCFHYIRWFGPVLGLGDGGFVPGAGVDSDSGEGPGL